MWAGEFSVQTIENYTQHSSIPQNKLMSNPEVGAHYLWREVTTVTYNSLLLILMASYVWVVLK